MKVSRKGYGWHPSPISHICGTWPYFSLFLLIFCQVFLTVNTGPERGPEKGGRKLFNPILKKTKPTRLPQKIKTPLFWSTSKWKFKNFKQKLEKSCKIHNFWARTKFQTSKSKNVRKKDLQTFLNVLLTFLFQLFNVFFLNTLNSQSVSEWMRDEPRYRVFSLIFSIWFFSRIFSRIFLESW